MHDLATLHYRDALVQSPTATEMYLACPQRYAWYLSRGAQRLTEAVMHGRRLHAALATVARSPLAAMCADPFLLQASDVLHAVHSALDASTLHVELRLGACRIDHVLLRKSDNQFIIVDYKYVHQIKQTSLLAGKLKHNHQLLHYAWAFSQYSDLWYRHTSFTIDIGICLIDNLIHHISTITVTNNDIKKWLANAVEIWYTMQSMRKTHNPYRNERSCLEDIYGTVATPCWYYNHCHETAPLPLPLLE
jgi:hypothetical protein